jgi:NADP-reducing hydrogenase subunit HndB
MNREELRQLREARRREWARQGTAAQRVQVIVGTGTCGVAAGAERTLAAFQDELKLHGVQDVLVRQTGCMGLCHAEPTVEVIMPGMPATIYGRVDDKVAREIVRRHILGRVLINDHLFDRPAADIIDPQPAGGR